MGREKEKEQQILQSNALHESCPQVPFSSRGEQKNRDGLNWNQNRLWTMSAKRLRSTSWKLRSNLGSAKVGRELLTLCGASS